jgi:hypothetical protein
MEHMQQQVTSALYATTSGLHVLPHLMEHTQQVTSALYATTSGLHVLPHI